MAALELQVARLGQSVGLKDEFISMVAHELRGPLTAIKGASRTLLRHQTRLAAETVRQLLEDIDDETERVDHLLDNLLALSRAEAGVGHEAQSTRLRPFLRRLVAEIRPRADGHVLRLRVQRELPPARVDPLRMEQVLRNLLDNAIKYSPAGARIVVAAGLTRDGLEVTVRNDGPRLEPLVLARVFDRFYRGPTAAGNRVGSGLGLTICRRLVEAQGGTIRAENVAGGVAFRITLPRSRRVDTQQ